MHFWTKQFISDPYIKGVVLALATMEDYLKACLRWMLFLGLKRLLCGIPNKPIWRRTEASGQQPQLSFQLASTNNCLPWEGGQLGLLSSTPRRMESFSRCSLWVGFGKTDISWYVAVRWEWMTSKSWQKGKKVNEIPMKWAFQTAREVGVPRLVGNGDLLW